jgi:CubicO group peptidase (beta-lactamase class C family)
VGYGLLGLISERLSGLPFDAVLRKGLFEPHRVSRRPVGLSQTGVV